MRKSKRQERDRKRTDIRERKGKCGFLSACKWKPINTSSFVLFHMHYIILLVLLMCINLSFVASIEWLAVNLRYLLELCWWGKIVNSVNFCWNRTLGAYIIFHTRYWGCQTNCSSEHICMYMYLHHCRNDTALSVIGGAIPGTAGENVPIMLYAYTSS